MIESCRFIMIRIPAIKLIALDVRVRRFYYSDFPEIDSARFFKKKTTFPARDKCFVHSLYQ